MRRRSLAVFLFACLVPALAHAQATLAGVVRDSSDAVLPGVTVEAASPVLIQKVRTAVTDGSGQYRITELPPGSYTMTVALAGFSTVKREGVEVTGSGVIPINFQMRVGSRRRDDHGDRRDAGRRHAECPPPVGAQQRHHQYPAGDAHLWRAAVGRPGLQVQGNGSAATTPFMAMFTANGGRANEGRMMIDGLPVAASFNGGGVSTFIYDTPNADEMQVLVSGALGKPKTQPEL